jgi:hypothetical protein
MSTDAVLFSEEERLEQAEGNATAILVATLSFLRERGLSAQDWAGFVGTLFAPGWDNLQGAGVNEIARVVALNLATSGGRILSLEGDSNQAEVVVRWPADEGWLSDTNLQRADIQPALEIFLPIAERLGVQCRIVSKDGGSTTIQLRH